VNAIIVLGPDRVPLLPGVASTREAGLTDFDGGAGTLSLGRSAGIGTASQVLLTSTESRGEPTWTIAL
jgi:hypothetical protein